MRHQYYMRHFVTRSERKIAYTLCNVIIFYTKWYQLNKPVFDRVRVFNAICIQFSSLLALKFQHTFKNFPFPQLPIFTSSSIASKKLWNKFRFIKLSCCNKIYNMTTSKLNFYDISSILSFNNFSIDFKMVFKFILENSILSNNKNSRRDLGWNQAD